MQAQRKKNVRTEIVDGIFIEDGRVKLELPWQTILPLKIWMKIKALATIQIEFCMQQTCYSLG